MNINGSLTCTCNSGFTEDGLNCLSNNSLCVNVTYPCDRNAICVDSDGSFTCTCIPGFTGDGFNCQGNDFNFCDKLAIIVLLNQNVMLLISVTTILFVWTLMAPSHALAFWVSQEMGSTAKVIYLYACIKIITVEPQYTDHFGTRGCSVY